MKTWRYTIWSVNSASYQPNSFALKESDWVFSLGFFLVISTFYTSYCITLHIAFFSFNHMQLNFRTQLPIQWTQGTKKIQEFENDDMESLKRHSSLSLIFVLNFFSKAPVIRNVNLSSHYRVKTFRSLFFLFVILNCSCCFFFCEWELEGGVGEPLGPVIWFHQFG